MYILSIEKPAYIDEGKIYFVKERPFGFPEWTSVKEKAAKFATWAEAWSFRDTLAFNFNPEQV